eukprot:5765169-Pleurochrysis_carterae.AAC.1
MFLCAALAPTLRNGFYLKQGFLWHTSMRASCNTLLLWEVGTNTQSRVLASHVLTHLFLARPLCPPFDVRLTWEREETEGKHRNDYRPL